MCKHVYIYPENHCQAEELQGVCKICGDVKPSKGALWFINLPQAEYMNKLLKFKHGHNLPLDGIDKYHLSSLY